MIGIPTSQNVTERVLLPLYIALTPKKLVLVVNPPAPSLSSS